MAFYKNKADQGITVYAVDADGDPVINDAANITAYLVKDGGSPTATDDTNPTEIGLGLYRFTPTQAESNADEIVLVPTSATDGVRIEPVQIFTEPEARILDAAYDAAKTAATQASVTAIATILSGITSLANWLRALLRSDTPDSTALAEINSGGGTYTEKMSQQSLRSIVGSIDLTTGNIEQVVSEDGVIIAQGTTDGKLLIADGKVAATLTSADVTGNLPAQVKAQDNIDFGALQKASLNALALETTVNAVGTLVTQVPAATVSGIRAMTLDGVSFEDLMECVLAVVAGKTSVNDSVVTFMKRDGTTGRIRVTVGSSAGSRTASEIL